MRRGPVVVATFALVALTALTAASYVVPVHTVTGESEDVRAPRGCPPPGGRDEVPAEDRVTTVVPEATAPTAADHAAAGGVDLRAAVEDVRRMATRFVPVAEFELPSTGIVVSVLSDGPVEVDVEAFDRLWRLLFDDPDVFRDRRVATVQRCYLRRLVEERELAGHELRVVVPADPSTCFLGGRFVPVGEDGFAASCDSAGVALPRLELGLRPFGLSVVDAASPATVLVTAAAVPGHPDPETRVAWLLLHELHHVVENAFGLTPWSGSLRHYEQRAYYVERELRRHLAERGVRPPLPIRYP